MMKKQLMLIIGVLFATLVIGQDKNIPPPPPPVPAVENLTPPPSVHDDYKSFLKRNPSVKSLGWLANGSSVRIRLKSGKEELYNLNSEKEIAVLNRKYGRLPIAPPPPPPRAPVEL